jgi:ABC-type branched-subunit amino acid transport system permease subunit
MAMTYAIICLGLNVQWGQTGLFNVGIAGFVAARRLRVSAVADDAATADRIGGFGLPIAARLGGGDGGGRRCRVLVGLLTIRMRADYLAITTFGFAVALQLAAFQNADKLTGGAFGMGFIPRPFASLAGAADRVQPRQPRAARGGRAHALPASGAPAAQPLGTGAARGARGRGRGRRRSARTRRCSASRPSPSAAR